MEPSVILPELPTYLFAPTLPGVLSLILTVLLPVGAALVMRQSWSTMAKGLTLFGAAAVKTFAEAWLLALDSHAAFNAVTTAYAVLINFGIAVVAYFGLFKNTAVQRAALEGGIVRDKVIDGTFTTRTGPIH